MLDFENNPLFMGAPVAYSVLDSAGRHVTANPRFWELFGLPESGGLSVDAITHSESKDDTAAYLAELLSGDRDSVVTEKRYVRADGSEFWGRLTARRLETDDNELLVLGVIENIDEQRELEAQLREAAKDQSEFVARVSHELRNPLHTIAGLAELLTTSDVEPHAQRQASIILREATSLTSIVSDLLDIGKFDTGNLAIAADSFAVRTVIDRSVRAAKMAVAEKGLRLNAMIDDALPIYAVGDAGRLGQVVDNLLGNAIKFTTIGSVSLDVKRRSADMVEFVVSDTGPGIPADRQAEIFEPFQRLNPSAPGAGLGLAISGRLASSMGGDLQLRSSDPDGSTFVLTVPLVEGLAPISQPVEGPKMAQQKTSRILVVEDNRETQMLASAQLERLGYEHDIVGDGFEALTISDKTPYGAILMDWHLPGIDGLETTRRIRQREQREGRPRTPIISVTARAMAADIEACREAGADDFVAKPASIARIGEVLALWAGSSTANPGESEADDAVDTAAFSTLLDELGDTDLIISLAQTFLSELPRRISTIIDSVDDIDAVQLASHTLKSTSAMVGAEDLRSVAESIEESARNGSVVSASTHEALRVAAERTKNEVSSLIEKLENAR